MNARFVNEMAQGSCVDADFLVRTKDLRSARTGDSYLTFELSDRTGSIRAVLFRPPRTALEIPAGSVARVKGRVTTFKGSKRVSVDEMRPSEGWKTEELVATGSRPAEELIAEFGALVRSVKDRGLSRLLRCVFSDREFFEGFCRCPATHDGHHRHIGGLIEHTVSVAGLCDTLEQRYEGIDRDVLIASALLHDIGQVEALCFETGISQTEAGRLLGHVALGGNRVRTAAARLNLAERQLTRVEHAVLVHHDQGVHDLARRSAATMEALVLGHADSIDAQIAEFANAVSGALRAEEPWTDSRNSFGRALSVGGSDDPGLTIEEDEGSRRRLSA